MKYTNTTKSSVFAGGSWVKQGAETPDISKLSAIEKHMIEAGHLAPAKQAKAKQGKAAQKDEVTQ